MAKDSPQKCLHKGCGKLFTFPSESECHYHPGPPVFHEGQKGWKCCKPRTLTFDEFLAIPPCTTGVHSAIDDTPVPEPPTEASAPPPQPIASLPAPQPKPQRPTPTGPAPAPEPEPDSDDDSITIPPSTTCKRRGCGARSSSTATTPTSRQTESCVHHPGHPLFHEGQKGWQCCKPRVFSFDEFLEIKGCLTKDRHLFVGKPKTGQDGATNVVTETRVKDVKGVRQDFYQTPTTFNLSLYVKGVRKEDARVRFENSKDSTTGVMEVEFETAQGERFQERVELYGLVDVEKCQTRVLGTKVEVTIQKSVAGGWPVLRSGEEPPKGQILQVGAAGRA